MDSKDLKNFRIPTEDVSITKSEAAVTQTRTFQRLFYMKQLGLAYLVYPAANHTRGAHSLRCLAEVEKILVALEREHQIEPGDRLAIRMAALLHDIGHFPFSHTLEDENKVFRKHDDGDRLIRLVNQLMDELNPEYHPTVQAALEILKKLATKVPDWKCDVIGNTVCADLFAYILDDAANTGIEKKPGYYRLYQYFTLEKDKFCILLTKGGLRVDVVSAILDLLDMRYSLTERVIFHHAKCIASAMLARAVRMIGMTDEEPGLTYMGDEVFLNHLEQHATKLQKDKNPNGDGAFRLLNALRARRLYKRVFKVDRLGMENYDQSASHGAFAEKWRKSENIEEMLVRIEDECGLPRGALALWCTDGNSGMKLVKAQVVWDGTNGRQGPFTLRSEELKQQFPRVWDRVDTIEQQYKSLWTFWVALHRDHLDKIALVIRHLEDALMIDCDRAFIETYLKEYAGEIQLHDNIRRGMQSVESEVHNRIVNAAAYADKKEVDPAAVLSVVKTVLDEKFDVQKASVIENRPDLFNSSK